MPLENGGPRPRIRLARTFWIGLAVLGVGSGPLVATLWLAWLGVTDDPHPNPVGLGILAFLTFWPGVGLMIVGIVRSFSRQSSRR